MTRVLTPENRVADLNRQIPHDLHYCVLDCNEAADPDFFFIPLLLIQNNPRSIATIQIGKFQVAIPAHWSVLVTARELGEADFIPIEELAGREFEVFVWNPLKDYMPQYLDMRLVECSAPKVWIIPKLKRGHVLVVPVSEEPGAPCAMFVEDMTKLQKGLDITNIFAG